MAFHDRADAGRELASRLLDDTICAWMPEPFHAVGMWYTDFGQTTDEEVRQLLEAAVEQQPRFNPAKGAET